MSNSKLYRPSTKDASIQLVYIALPAPMSDGMADLLKRSNGQRGSIHTLPYLLDLVFKHLAASPYVCDGKSEPRCFMRLIVSESEGLEVGPDVVTIGLELSAKGVT